MDFSWTEQQQARYDATVRFAREELDNEGLLERERPGTFPHDLWKRAF